MKKCKYRLLKRLRYRCACGKLRVCAERGVAMIALLTNDDLRTFLRKADEGI